MAAMALGSVQQTYPHLVPLTCLRLPECTKHGALLLTQCQANHLSCKQDHVTALMPSLHLSTKSSIFDSADPRDVSAYVNDFVGRHSIQLTSATTANARLLFHKLSDIGLCNISYGNQVDITTEALLDSYQLQVLLRGTFAWTGAESRHQFNPVSP